MPASLTPAVLRRTQPQLFGADMFLTAQPPAPTLIQDLSKAADAAGISVMLRSGIKHPEQVQGQRII